MPIVGGLRDRLIIENMKMLIEDNLNLLGWFDTENQLIANSLTVLSSPVDDTEELLPNIISLSPEEKSSDELELGSDFSEYRWQVYVDIYAEDHASGLHLCGDVEAIISGKLASIGRVGKHIPIYDLTMATPPIAFYIEIDNIVSSKQRFYNRNFERHWWTVGFEIIDSYYDDVSEPGYESGYGGGY